VTGTPAGRPLLVVLRALGLGDLLTAVPALRALARAYPGHRRVLVAPAALAGLALRSGAVDELAPAGPLEPLPADLHGAEVAVNLHGRGPESTRLLLAARPRRLLAFAHPGVPASLAGPAWLAGEHEVRRWCRLLAAWGVTADPSDLDLPRAGARDEGTTLVHPGAASPARRWPPERFAAVAAAEAGAGRRVRVTGGPEEVGLAVRVARAAGLPATAVRAGRTNLVELADLVAQAGAVVCGDTGVAHLATAMGTPSVVLFGPTPPAEWGLPPDRGWHRALWAGGRGDPHGTTPDPGLLRLEVGQVLAALAAARASAPGARSGARTG
jgi:ADP-heptose:LPS heptosyltransferase